MERDIDIGWGTFADGLRAAVLLGRPVVVVDVCPSSPALSVTREACVLAGRPLRVLDLASWPGESPFHPAESRCHLSWAALLAEGEAGKVALATTGPAPLRATPRRTETLPAFVEALVEAGTLAGTPNAGLFSALDGVDRSAEALRDNLARDGKTSPRLDAYLALRDAAPGDGAVSSAGQLAGLKYLQRAYPGSFDPSLGRPALSPLAVARGEAVLVVRCNRSTAETNHAQALLGAVGRQARALGLPAPEAFTVGDTGTRIPEVLNPGAPAVRATPDPTPVTSGTEWAYFTARRTEWDDAHRLHGAAPDAAYVADDVATAVLLPCQMVPDRAEGAMLVARAWPDGRYACAAAARMHDAPRPGDADAVASAVARGAVDPFLDADGVAAIPGVGTFSFHPLTPDPAKFWGLLFGGRRAVAELEARADRVLSAACHASVPSEMHDWVAAGPDRRARRDFVLTWRGLANEARAVEAVVDAGGRTLPAVADHLGLDVARTRRLLGRDALPCDAATLAAFLSALDVNLVPDRDDPRGWDGFVRSVSVLAKFGRDQVLSSRTDALLGILMRSAPDWPSRAELAEAERLRLQDARDMFRALTGTLCLVTGLGPGNGHAAVSEEILLAHRNIRALLDASVRWHAHPVLSAWDGGPRPVLPDDHAWPPLFEGTYRSGNLFAVALTTPLALREEGMAGPDREGVPGLGHCVSGYRWACAAGGTHVIAVRRAVGQGHERVSTLEIAGDARGGLLVGGVPHRIVQHKAAGNTEPPADARDLVTRLMRALVDGSLPPVPDALVERPLPPGPLENGMDAEAVHGLWRPLLPPSWGRLDIEGFRARASAVRDRARRR